MQFNTQSNYAPRPRYNAPRPKTQAPAPQRLSAVSLNRLLNSTTPPQNSAELQTLLQSNPSRFSAPALPIAIIPNHLPFHQSQGTVIGHSSIDGMPLLQLPGGPSNTLTPIARSAQVSAVTNAGVTGPGATQTTQATQTGTTDESSPPLGFEGLSYGSASAAQANLTLGKGEDYVACCVPTSAAAFQMHSDNTGNMFNPQWKQAVEQAAQVNGGLGDSVNGYLAYSKDQGFVRLLNPNLTPEQNREMAAISLQSGWAVENTPARSGDPVSDPKINDWVNNFSSNYSTQLGNFIQSNGATPMQIKDGRRTMSMQYDAQSGLAVSMCVKKHGGFAGFIQDHSSEIEGALAVASVACPILGVATVGLTAGLAAASLTTQAIATGGLSFQAVAGAALSVGGLPPAEAALGNAAINAGGDLIQNGKLTASDVAGLGIAALNVPDIGDAGILPGLDPSTIRAIQGGLGAGADLIDNGKLTLSDLANVAAPLALAGTTGSATMDHQLENGIKLLATGVQTGKITAQQVVNALQPTLLGDKTLAGDPVDGDTFKGLLSNLTTDPTTQKSIYAAFGLLAKRQDLGQVSLQDILKVFQPFVDQANKERVSGQKQPQTA